MHARKLGENLLCSVTSGKETVKEKYINQEVTRKIYRQRQRHYDMDNPFGLSTPVCMATHGLARTSYNPPCPARGTRISKANLRAVWGAFN